MIIKIATRLEKCGAHYIIIAGLHLLILAAFAKLSASPFAVNIHSSANNGPEFPYFSTAFDRPSSNTAVAPASHTTAQSFVDSIGVNVHMAYTDTAYKDISSVEHDLNFLGMHHVRDKLAGSGNAGIAHYERLASDGIKFDFNIPVYLPSTVNLRDFIGMLDRFVRAHPGSVSAIEGPNEVNVWPGKYNGGTDLANEASLQQALYAAVRANGSLKGIPVYNLTLAGTDPSQFRALGDLSGAANYANSHAYLYDKQTPAFSLGIILPYAQIDAPGLPTVITETGYETNPASNYSGVDISTQAKLTLDELLDTFAAGVRRTYLYELIDESGQNFGLFNADGTPKPAAIAIHNLTTLLSDHGDTSSVTPKDLTYAIPNLPANANRLLFEKNNGTYELIIWAEEAIWNPRTRSEIAAKSKNITVNFGTAQKLIKVFDPLLNLTPIATYRNVQAIQAALTDHPLVVDICGEPRC